NRRRSRLLVVTIAMLTLAVGLTLDGLLRTYVAGWFPLVTALALAGMAGALWLAHAFGDHVVLASLGATAPDPERHGHRQLLNVVREMAVASGLPEPRVLVIPDPAPNALATGIDPAHATVAVTTGLLEKLDRAQTQGVVAHEMAHV